MAEYVIQGETLTAIANKIRQYTTVVGNNTHIIDEQYAGSNGWLAQEAV